MQHYLKSMYFLQDNLISWLSFFVLSFFLDVCTVGVFSFSILREAKRAWLAKDSPNISIVWKDVPWDLDLLAWGWHMGIRVGIRIISFLFLWPVYHMAGGLWSHVTILGFFAYGGFALLIIIFFALESIFMHWLQLLHIDGYTHPKDALKLNWVYIKKMSHPVAEFCLLENILHIPFLFSCVMPAVISRPVILIARLIAYEEEREHVHQLAKEKGILRVL